MTRAELVQLIYEKNNCLNYALVEQVVKQFFQELINGLIQKKRIEIRGFGSFTVKLSKPRTIWNPKINQFISTERKYMLYFKPGKALKNQVNEKELYVEIN